MIDAFGLEITTSALTLGVIVGVTYGSLAIGLILVYRSSGVINFAHGEIGALGAAVLGIAVTRWSFPYWIAMVTAVVVSGATGAITEMTVIRRLRKAPPLMSVVATLGVAQFVLLLTFSINSQVTAGRAYPQPSFMPTFEVGALRVTSSFSAMLLLTPLLVVALVAFLHHSWSGLAIRGAAANEDSARLAGIFPGRMSGLSWALAGAIAGFTAVLLIPTRGFITAEFFGPGLLLRALVPALIARMFSLPWALAGGIAVGLVEQVVFWNFSSGVADVALLVIVITTLLANPQREGRAEPKGRWTVVQPWRPVPDEFKRIWEIRNLSPITASVGLLFFLCLPLVMTNSAAIIMTAILSFALVGLSIGVITGLGGQLSLGQFALAGVGAAVAFHVTSATGNHALAFLVAALSAGAVSVVVGLPALRIRGPMLTVTTLSFALAAQTWLLKQPWMLGDGVEPDRVSIAGLILDTGKKYYLFALVVFVAAFGVVRNFWRTGLARRLVALRDNESAARAFTIPPTSVRIQAFAFSGFLAGLGGAVFANSLSRITPVTFSVGASINVVAMAVLGGIGIVAGPLIGALYIVGVPRFIPLDSAGLAASALGWLVLILYFPGGLAQLVRPARDGLVRWLARRRGLDPDAIWEGGARDATAGIDRKPGRVLDSRRTVHEGGVLLSAAGLHKSYGGLQAVHDVSLHAAAGEIVGLIGPNGAGKTTLFEILGGFTRADEGTVRFMDLDISGKKPESRARLGLIRSFQDSTLFPTMTVVDAVKLALERKRPTRLTASLLGFKREERRKRREALEVVRLLGLEPFQNRQISELSTGTRRLTELACVVALDPVVLLLDEPSSGIAQRETEALGRLLVRLRDELGITMIVIEHDVPLIMSVADRMIAMETGRIIAEGTPEQISVDPLVVESYLGGDPRAIHRSGREPATLATDRGSATGPPVPSDGEGQRPQ